MKYIKRDLHEHRTYHPPCGHADDLVVIANDENGGRPGWCFDFSGEDTNLRFVTHCPDCGAALPRLRWYGRKPEPVKYGLSRPPTKLELLIGDRLIDLDKRVTRAFFREGPTSWGSFDMFFINSKYCDIDKKS